MSSISKIGSTDLQFADLRIAFLDVGQKQWLFDINNGLPNCMYRPIWINALTKIEFYV